MVIFKVQLKGTGVDFGHIEDSKLFFHKIIKNHWRFKFACESLYTEQALSVVLLLLLVKIKKQVFNEQIIT